MRSTRRVGKGPSRRPQSEKRQRFMELRERGWSVSGAACEIGVSRSTGNNWTHGYKTYRQCAVVGMVAPLDRLAVRQVSAAFLSQDERFEIADLRREGLGVREVARRLGRAPSTVSRELRRNASRGGYPPFEAHRYATLRRARERPRRLDTNPMLRGLVGELLGQRWSRQQISRNLHRQFGDEPSIRLCHESIYQAVYRPGSTLTRPYRVAPRHRSPLRTGRDHRRAQQRVERRRARVSQPMLTIHERPFPFADRAEAGHWEGDLIIGKDQHSAIGTLVERQTRFVRLLNLPARDSNHLHDALEARMGDLPAFLLRSITWDQGTEMARHLDIAATLSTRVYFCESRAPWQRESNEKTNGLLRQYFPKGTDLVVHTPEHLRAVEDGLNRRPRIVLNDRAPADLFNELLASPTDQVLRR